MQDPKNEILKIAFYNVLGKKVLIVCKRNNTQPFPKYWHQFCEKDRYIIIHVHF